MLWPSQSDPSGGELSSKSLTERLSQALCSSTEVYVQCSRGAAAEDAQMLSFSGERRFTHAGLLLAPRLLIDKPPIYSPSSHLFSSNNQKSCLKHAFKLWYFSFLYNFVEIVIQSFDIWLCFIYSYNIISKYNSYLFV